MKRSKKVLLLVGVLLVLGVGALVLVVRSLPQNRFPQWEKTDASVGVEEEAVLHLVALEKDTFSGETPADKIQVLLENRGEQPLSYGAGYWLEYFYQDQWYTVWQLEQFPAMSHNLDPQQKREATFLAPPGFFSEKGQYRLYVDGLGYCVIPNA